MTLLERIDAAIERVKNGEGNMRIPADLTDPDIVLAECWKCIKDHRSELAQRDARPHNETCLYHSRWVEAQNRLAEYERRLIRLAGIEASIPDCIDRIEEEASYQKARLIDAQICDLDNKQIIEDLRKELAELKRRQWVDTYGYDPAQHCEPDEPKM